MQLLCVGDVAFADGGLPRAPWRRPGGLFSGDETRILINWELPIGDTINPVPRVSGPRLVAHPDTPRIVESWSPGFATLATNHILDAGTAGLAGTIEALRRIGFVTVGAGQARSEIARPLLWATGEGTLGLVNWVFPETHPEWLAVPGPNCWPGLAEAEGMIRELKRTTTWVLVVIHWSDELFPYPRPQDRQIGRELARMGADLVIGHHPHVVRGMELAGSCPVFYSIGNFYFEDFADGRGGWVVRGAPRDREGLGVEISFRRGERPRYRLLSFWNTGREVIPDPLRRAVRRMATVSRPLQQFQDSEYAAWYGAERARFDRWGSRWHFGVRRLGLHGTMQRLLQKALQVRWSYHL